MRFTLDEVLSMTPEATSLLADRVQTMTNDEIRALFAFTLEELLTAIAKDPHDLLLLTLLVHPSKAKG